MPKTMLRTLAVALLLNCGSLLAGYLPVIADFNRCPAVGQSVACAVLFIIDPVAGSDYVVTAYAVTDVSGAPAVQPYDGSDDTLYGVLNKSGSTIPSLSLGFYGPVL